MKSKKVVLGIILVIVVLCAGGYYWYSQIKVPYDQAVSTFNKAAKVVTEKNTTLDKEIEKGQKILDAGEKPLDEGTFTDLQVAISTAKETKRTIPKVPDKLDKVKDETNKLQKELDYSSISSKLEVAITSANNSITQLKQVTNPSQDFVIPKLKEIQSIEDILPVTEDNDPNGNLNKAGGYTSAIYFSSTFVDQSMVSGMDLISKGTLAGGCIEVYKTAEEATKRNDYLATFDGGILSTGSHTVLGTIVVRTSDNLTATNQKNLETEIVAKLTSI
ncbi:hypothetical protein IGI37_003090 [Enterococcus sp. AZ194]|uniref:EbhA n=1 Tax=Enterococcus sp. AZ194 TaxID=2774629 RepID=UPI003F240DDB